ncbi:glycosyltransferase family 2 protein [Ramlibacter sp. AW1]|uniref:Glycosyltransferase family 2 protein n=1 Tax=Ramlibacter aurantiacus TaxID=2801330 RepID=A0A937D0M8_9BURK|nr:glycosyltransferase family 2 protein [Ramlibacter aurantiacus]MBL0419599.1 glycosyltransferase family 2 protein [Ramlibacter aurantiacus]
MQVADIHPSKPTTLSIVVPCFNEEAVLHATWDRLADLLRRLVAAQKISADSEIVFVDDGSSDATWRLIQTLISQGHPVSGIKLSRNCGHQNALLAGLSEARGDAVVTIDADLQDDESSIEQMVDAFHGGCEVVYGVRRHRHTDTWFKRGTARAFYRLMEWLGVRTVPDHADYRLLSRRAIEQLMQFDEVNLFLRGVVPLLGLRSSIVRYDRKARTAGESKYPLRKMLEFAIDGITSFSTSPLRSITVAGMLLSVGCLLTAGWAVFVRFTSPDAVPGWTSTILPIFLLGGVQLFCFGVIGEYVGKIYMESKRRPRFFIEQSDSAHAGGSSAIRGNATHATSATMPHRAYRQAISSAAAVSYRATSPLDRAAAVRRSRSRASDRAAGVRTRHGRTPS